jgi:hypothetical protein
VTTFLSYTFIFSLRFAISLRLLFFRLLQGSEFQQYYRPNTSINFESSIIKFHVSIFFCWSFSWCVWMELWFCFFIIITFCWFLQIYYFQNVFESDFLGIIAFREACQTWKVPYWPICMSRCLFILLEKLNNRDLISIFCCIFCRDFSYNRLSGSFPSWATQKNLQLYVWFPKFLLWTVYSLFFKHKTCLVWL